MRMEDDRREITVKIIDIFLFKNKKKTSKNQNMKTICEKLKP